MDGLTANGYVGPFVAFVNSAKLGKKKTWRKKWMECFAFVNTGRAEILLKTCSQGDKTRYQFVRGTGQSSTYNTTVKKLESYKGKQNVVQIRNVQEMSEITSGLREAILAFKDGKTKSDFFLAVCSCMNEEEELMSSSFGSLAQTDPNDLEIATLTQMEKVYEGNVEVFWRRFTCFVRGWIAKNSILKY